MKLRIHLVLNFESFSCNSSYNCCQSYENMSCTKLRWASACWWSSTVDDTIEYDASSELIESLYRGMMFWWHFRCSSLSCTGGFVSRKLKLTRKPHVYSQKILVYTNSSKMFLYCFCWGTSFSTKQNVLIVKPSFFECQNLRKSTLWHTIHTSWLLVSEAVSKIYDIYIKKNFSACHKSYKF